MPDEKNLKRFYFRGTANYNGNGLQANPDAKETTVFGHVNNGSKKSSQYISLTESVGVAISYAFDYGQTVKDNEAVKEDVAGFRKKIVLISSERMPQSEQEQLLTTGEIEKRINEEKPENKGKKAVYYAQASREAIIPNAVSKEACVELPQIYADILYALECEANSGGIGKSKLRPADAQAIIDTVCQMMFDPEQRKILTKDVIKSIDFEDYEKDFMIQYYATGDTRKTLVQISEGTFEGNRDVAHGVRADIIRKIINSNVFRSAVGEEFARENMPEFLRVQSQNPKAPIVSQMAKIDAWWKNAKGEMSISPTCYDKSIEGVCARTAKKRDEIKDGIIKGSVLVAKLKEGERYRVPFSVRSEIGEDGTRKLEPQYMTYVYEKEYLGETGRGGKIQYGPCRMQMDSDRFSGKPTITQGQVSRYVPSVMEKQTDEQDKDSR